MSREKMSGLEMMQAMVAGKIPHASISKIIPMKGVAAEYGRVVFEAAADERHLNPMGGVHGGFASTVLDSATGCAIHTVLGPGEGYGTIDLNVKMLKAVPKDIPLKAEGKVVQVSRTIGVSEASLTDAGGKIYAYATATCMIFRQGAANGSAAK
ncbi:MAG: PaaI family thioesterase [Desulfosalsimonas sp.]